MLLSQTSSSNVVDDSNMRMWEQSSNRITNAVQAKPMPKSVFIQFFNSRPIPINTKGKVLAVLKPHLWYYFAWEPGCTINFAV